MVAFIGAIQAVLALVLPIAGYCVEVESGLALWGLVGDAASGRIIRAQAQGTLGDPDSLGLQVAELLRAQGADAMLGRV